MKWTLLLMPWGRVGSNLCNDLVVQSKTRRVYNEPFTEICTKYVHKKNNEIWSYQKKWLEDFITTPNSEKQAFVNLSANSIMDTYEFSKFLDKHKCNVIYLDRKDIFATALSALRAASWSTYCQKNKKAGAWSISKNDKINFKPNLDIDELKEYIKIASVSRTKANQILENRNYTKYYYEDLTTDINGFLRDFIEKAEINFFQYEISTKKFGDNKLVNIINNPEEIKKLILEERITTQLK